jgi:hypothetical protein
MNEDMNAPNVSSCLRNCLTCCKARHIPDSCTILSQVRRKHFVTAAKSVRRRITPEVIQEYEEWRDRSGVRSA